MHENIINAFVEARARLGLSITDIARKIYHPEKFGTHANRAHLFFRTGKGSRELVLAIAGVLGISFEEMVELSRKDQQDNLARWNRVMDEPIRPFLKFFARWLETKPIYLPDHLKTEAELIDAAMQVEGDPRFKRRLVVSNRVTLWLDKEGKIDRREEARPNLPLKPFITPPEKQPGFCFPRLQKIRKDHHFRHDLMLAVPENKNEPG
jgi:hypothetical protein